MKIPGRRLSGTKKLSVRCRGEVRASRTVGGKGEANEGQDKVSGNLSRVLCLL